MSTFRKGFRMSCIYKIKINNSKPIFARTFKLGVVKIVSMVYVNNLNSCASYSKGVCRSCGFVSISGDGLQTKMDEENIIRAQVIISFRCFGSATTKRFFFQFSGLPENRFLFGRLANLICEGGTFKDVSSNFRCLEF